VVLSVGVPSFSFELFRFFGASEEVCFWDLCSSSQFYLVPPFQQGPVAALLPLLLVVGHVQIRTRQRL